VKHLIHWQGFVIQFLGIWKQHCVPLFCNADWMVFVIHQCI